MAPTDELAKHLADYPPVQGGLVFTMEEGHAINRNNFRSRVWLKALQKAGLHTPIVAIRWCTVVS